jgi:DedD protein
MAFFKSRKGGDEPQATPTGSGRQPESIEAIRRRAKHRLIGAFVLVLVGVIGFPLLFDTQPRPISVDIPIEIPDRNKAKPLPAPVAAPAVTQAPPAASSGVVAPAPSVAKVETPPAPRAEAKAEPEPKAEAKAEPKPEPKTESKVAEVKPQAKPQPRADDGSRAQALLEGQTVASTPVIAEGRFVVQVGSFSENDKAREARMKLERAGMRTYTQVVEKDGKRLIRVRVGPFATKSDAEKAAERVKGLALQAAVLTL